MVSKTALAVGGASILSLIVGSIGGYLFAVRMLEERFREELDKEVEEARRHFKVLRTKEYESPQEAVEALGLNGKTNEELQVFRGVVESLMTYQGSYTPQEEQPEELDDEVNAPGRENHNVFEGVKEMTTRYDEDEREMQEMWEREVADRDINHPYVISVEEFSENTQGFEQETLTYYLGDKVLADSRDRAIDDISQTVGESNLLRFGFGSGDKRIVYVRNHKYSLDLEIVLDDEKYATKVLGFDDTPVQGVQRGHNTNSSPRPRFNDQYPGGVVQVGD